MSAIFRGSVSRHRFGFAGYSGMPTPMTFQFPGSLQAHAFAGAAGIATPLDQGTVAAFSASVHYRSPSVAATIPGCPRDTD